MSRKPSRRRFLELSGMSLGSIATSSIASAQGESNQRSKGSAGIDTGFDPDDRTEVVRFVQDIEDVDNLRPIFTQLTKRQREAVRKILQPVNITVETKNVTTESQISTASRWQPGTAVYTAYAEGLYPYDRLWQFSHEANWEYDGDEVRNVTHRISVATDHPLWHWKGLIYESKNVRDDDFIAYKQGKFSYCEPVQVGCVQSDTPYIEITGDSLGSAEAESNYKQE